MNFKALEKSIRVLEKSWKSPGNLFLRKGTNPVKAIHHAFSTKKSRVLFSPVPYKANS